MSNSQKVVTRIAPSPTGLFHIGTARVALFNYLYAQQHNGTFVVRIEDTDKVRSEKKYEENILEGLEWLRLHTDTVVRQSERMEGYAKALKTLVEEDKAYVSKEPAKNDPEKMVEIVRLRNSGKEITFQDEVRGEVTFDTTELGDFVIARSLTDPLYHLAVVVDDEEMGITHVIRGEDHISNTPRQILIQEALGYSRPTYAHLPLILAPDKSKLSKRKGAVSVSDYRDQGFLASALVNHLALLGWNPGTEKEVYTLEELLKDFSLKGVQKGGAVFDIEKLKWLNREHRSQLDTSKQHELVISQLGRHPILLEVFTRSGAALDDILERFSTTVEFLQALGEGDYNFYESRPVLVKDKITWRKDSDSSIAKTHLEAVLAMLKQVDENNFTKETIKEIVWSYAEEHGKGSVLWPTRYALSGKERSPDPFLLAEALGKEETLERINVAISCIKQ